jgi:hypothetical protein
MPFERRRSDAHRHAEQDYAFERVLEYTARLSG